MRALKRHGTKTPGTELREQGAVRLGGDGAALAGRRADCVRRECTHAEVASCGKGCVRMECRRGVGEACGDEAWAETQNGAKVSRGVRKLASAEGARARGGSSLPRVGLTGRRVPTCGKRRRRF